jgi:hypothetical protein
LRLKPVNAAARELARAEAELSRLKDQRDHLAASGGQKRNELRTGISQRDASIAELTAQLGKEGEVHQKNLDGIREACRIIKDRCMVPRSQAEDSRYAAAVKGLGSELERQRDERKELQSQIDELVSVDAGDAADIGRSIATMDGVVTDARGEFRTAVDGSQIYRLAANWYGVSTSDVTSEQFAMARGCSRPSVPSPSLSPAASRPSSTTQEIGHLAACPFSEAWSQKWPVGAAPITRASVGR